MLDENRELAKAVVEDFAGARVLDRLLMYERRIESSLYRAMAELRRQREARAAGEPQETSPLESISATAQEPAPQTKLASFGAEVSLGGVSSAKGRASSDDSDFKLHTSNIKLEEKITPYGVTTNEEGCVTGAGTETLHASPFTLHDPSRETNPIAGGPSTCEESIHDSIGGGKCGIVPWTDSAAGG